MFGTNIACNSSRQRIVSDRVEIGHPALPSPFLLPPVTRVDRYEGLNNEISHSLRCDRFHCSIRKMKLSAPSDLAAGDGFETAIRSVFLDLAVGLATPWREPITGDRMGGA